MSASDQAIATINLIRKAYIRHFESIQIPWMLLALLLNLCACGAAQQHENSGCAGGVDGGGGGGVAHSTRFIHM